MIPLFAIKGDRIRQRQIEVERPRIAIDLVGEIEDFQPLDHRLAAIAD